MIMKHSFLFFYFVGTFIQLQMNFWYFGMMLTRYSVTAVLTPVPRWTFMDSWKQEARPDAWDESVFIGCLSKPNMNARDRANVIRKL